jgi:hypothetical protein
MTTGAGALRFFALASISTVLTLFIAVAIVEATEPTDLTVSRTTLTLTILIVLAVAFLAVGAWAVVVGTRGVRRIRRVLAEGYAVEATVVNIDQSATELNERPATILTLAYRDADGTMTSARVKQLVPMNLVKWLTLGYRLRVRVDRDDPRFVVIDWPEAGRRRLMSRPGLIADVAVGLAVN